MWNVDLGKRFWKVWVDDECVIHREYGLKDGKISHMTRKITKGKAGRTPMEQAILEAKSMYNKKKPTGAPEPMLAHEYKKHSKKMPEDIAVQPKLDGVRMIVKRTDDGFEMFTRTGKPVTNMNHLVPELQKILKVGQIVDGEVYDHDIDFNIISGKFRRNEESENLKYYIFDVVDFEKSFQERFKKFVDKKFIFHVPYEIIKKSKLAEYHQKFLDQGYEGIMVRNVDAVYESGRSFSLLKYKDFHDKEFEITDITSGKDGVPIFQCNNQFTTRIKGSNDEKQKYLDNKETYIGKMMTVRYQELSDSGVPRFPVGIQIRDYE